MAIKFHFSALLQPQVGSAPEVRSQKSEVRSQESEVRSQKKSLFSWLLAPGSWLLAPRSWLLAPGSWVLTFYFLLFQPASAVAQQAVLSVVKSQENANQWTGITTRLQAARVGYCAIDLTSVKSAADFGNTAVLFLPNVETLTPTQAIALNDWVSRGGHIITSGPVGDLSEPGVRQMLRATLGAYWGFSLSSPSQLEPLRTSTQETWLHSAGLAGIVSGGVVIPTGLTSQPAAIWRSKDSAPAVVITDQATVLGWSWGVDAESSAQLDSAWLRVLLNHYVQLSSGVTTNPTCPAAVAQSATPPIPAITPATPQPKPPPKARPAPPAPVAQSPIAPNPTTTTVTPQPKTPPAVRPTLPSPSSGKLSAITPRPIARGISSPPAPCPLPPAPCPLSPASPALPPPQQSKEPTAQLTFQGLETAPDAREPVSDIQAIALPQELENLIGRFESAELDADAKNSSGNQPTPVEDDTKVASNNIGSLGATLPEPALQVVAQAREIAKALPQLIGKQNYTAARQQWLKAQQLLWNHYPTNRNLAQPEIRAMWLDRQTIVRAGSEQRLARIFDQLAAAGINTVFFETVNAGYPIYPSQVAPQQNPLVRGWDPLAAAVKLAHERGMELHAWVWTFAVGNQRHNLLLNLPADYPGPVIAAHPNWASYDNRGSLFPPGQGKPFLDPANLEARRYLLQLFDEIVSRYQVDGLQLDYIRYPFQDPGADRTYGYGMAARQLFQQMTGVDPAQISPRDRDLWQKWTEFRTQEVDSFVAEVAQRLRQKRPHLILSVAVYPFTEHDRIHKLQQHWEVWARRGDVDLVVPMTYALDTYRFQHLAQPWLASVDLGSTLILPGIRLYNLPLSVAIDQIQLIRDLPVSGYSLFAVNNLSTELETVFEHTQGSAGGGSSGFLERAQGTKRSIPQSPVPYRQPFSAAAVRFEALQQEWNFLLANQQLWLREPELSSWRTQAKDLESALNQLAAAPSVSRAAAARASLTAFASHFQDWMRLQALDHPYQVKVWLNRLNTLEMLLRYGERVVLKQEVPPVAQRP